MRGLAGKHWLKETIVLGSGFGFQRLARTQPEPTDPCAGGGGSQAHCRICSGAMAWPRAQQ